MEKPLDPLGHKQSRYERPQQNWICGRTAEGCPCPLGPDRRGHCRATGQCLPAKRGDHWLCTRAESQGGKCPEGPLPDGACCHPIPPCQPVRSLRLKRGRLAVSVTALTAGVLLLALVSPRLHNAWIDPGPLSSAHATSAARCGDCHAADAIKAGAAITPVNFTQERALDDSRRCLQCHALGPQPFDPHGAPPRLLAGIDRKLQAVGNRASAPALLKISSALSPHDSEAGNLACATCHQEHQGRDFDLKRLSDNQCQACHSVQFASFGSGHPDFHGYPYNRRTRIFFDHFSHLDKHFAENRDKAPASCQNCHALGPSGRLMLVKSFEQTCAACHSAQIQGEGMTTKGIAFFTVPGIDVQTLRQKGLPVGGWPELADGKLTPFMQLLLSSDPAIEAALQSLHGADLLDLSRASPAQLAAAAKLAWAVKGLLFDLETRGQEFLLEKVPADMKVTASRPAADLAGQIPRTLVIASRKEWFPALLVEVSNHRNGIEPPAQAPPSANAVKPAPTAAPSPAPASGDDSLLGAAAPPASAPRNAAVDDSLLAGGSDSLVPAPAPAKGQEPPGNAADTGDLLAGPAQPAAAATPAPQPAATPAPDLSAEDWAATGGWYRPEGGFTLFYRPEGHADPFLTAWAEASAGSAEGASPSASAAGVVFRSLSDPQAPGLCMKCHTVDDDRGKLVINWTAARPAPDDHPFTRFNHSAHFSVLTQTGCQTCHALDPQSGYAKYFTAAASGDLGQPPSTFESNFVPLTKALCVQCHTPRLAGAGCLECHGYHTGAFAAQMNGVIPIVGSNKASSKLP